MQYKQLAAVAAFAGFANAQTQCTSIVPMLPGCLLGYVASAAYYNQKCDITDIQCQAGNGDNYASIVNAAIPAAAMSQSGAASVCEGGNVVLPALDVGNSLTSCASSYSAQPSVSLDAIAKACQPIALSIPPCALGFIAEAAYSSHSCAIQDFACQCSNSNAIQLEVLTSVSAYCGGAGLSPVLQSVANICSCVTSQMNAGTGPTSTPATTTDSGSVTSPTTGATTGPSVTGSNPTGSSSASGSKTGGSSPSGSGSKTGGSSPSASGSNTGGSSPSGSGSKTGGSSPATTGPPMQGGSGGGNGGNGGNGGSKSLAVFTGAGATASAFGGIFGVVAGVVAFM